ncbi:MAG TPA: hypothetical protein VD837_16065 [Terriglobales bacterium]|nr:hypothetical protein [Terriglobales bacterium]
MNRDPIFQVLPSEALVDIANCLSFDPTINSTTPYIRLRELSDAQKLEWLSDNRNKLEDEFCTVGSWTFGSTKSYNQIVRDLADKIQVRYEAGADTEAVERAIVAKLWNDAVTKLTPAQFAALKLHAEALAEKYGTTLGKEMTGFAALGAAQMSGFGVYLLGSTLLGAINGALGLGLGFGAFTGLSSLISTVIGPIGWATLGLFTIVKLGAPNYKKILPAVILIATQRQMIPADVLRFARVKLVLPNLSDEAIQEIIASVWPDEQQSEESTGSDVAQETAAVTSEVPQQDPGRVATVTSQSSKLPVQNSSAAPGDQPTRLATEVKPTAKPSTFSASPTVVPRATIANVARMPEMKSSGVAAVRSSSATKPSSDTPPMPVAEAGPPARENNGVSLAVSQASGINSGSPSTSWRPLPQQLEATRDTPMAMAMLKALFDNETTRKTPSAAEVQKLRRDVDEISRAAARKATLAPKPRTITKQERTLFALRNRELCAIALELSGTEFLDLSPADQEAVREILRERQEMAAELEGQEKKDKRKEIKGQNDPKNEEPGKSQSKVQWKRKELRHTLRNLEFTDRALQSLCDMPHDRYISFLSVLGQMNEGFLGSKHDVPQTSPKVFQRDAGRDGKIYYRRLKGSTCAIVELIGNKNTQDSDYAKLRKGTDN